jgi:hypothetical protein
VSAPLDGFFAALGPFLAGQSTAADVEARLGASPSGSRRLALYQKLVARQRALLLSSLFPGVRSLAQQLDAGLWEELVDAFSAEHPPTHWDPNRFGEPFGDFIAARREKGAKLPAYLEELADYYWVEYHVMVAPRPTPDDGVGLDHTLCVRHYTHDVRGFALAFSRGESPPPPEARSQPLVLCRSRTTEQLFVLHATAAAFAVLGRRTGPDPLAGRVLPGLDPATLQAVERELVAWGVLAAP